ncbi:phosphoadenylyl-sulfate reductase [Candidatus Methylacidithermus pantelleriae]|uniref:Adenosine 5'-phosphosulfate reductase n=1 Tax=Candidatus Methylacidithermus pantelleriae TaxID=2744239 RepID=A0A8J2BPH8_9BACT|nr:phosphoadenylyl-sulfate reductase [Candidatus Methylacidithermus pantelleriae]CAF0696325.1 Phosphoadenosine phosphosulfate reductase [Candidatus Methylacidithermus pantelleriae]
MNGLASQGFGVFEEEHRTLLDDLEVGEIGLFYEDQEPEKLLSWAFERFGVDRVGFVTSFQLEGMVLLDMGWRLNPSLRVFTLDTGRLPPESYEMIDKVRERYGIAVEVVLPERELVEAMVRKHGANLFQKSVVLRLTCCHIRKILPLNRILRKLDAWVTGLRREQWATRANIRKIELDHDHDGIVKLNPLADWSIEMVWDYIRRFDVPVHPLYGKGYSSISCAPCTRPVPPGEDPRSGRWWWEKDAPKECGMHCSIETGGFEHEVQAILGESGWLGFSHRPKA